ncbi:MAG: hypothetical protein F4X84_07175 [Synechococcus sp. SB0662_bin_45]|nr:hypothetical protein [Synechococcus sp. SB0668_bin_13]MYE22114.1 hypothetical protein [Synechococcus sp. SB0662_bin_45]MYG63212.1 hypothetical protein [Synechococcus sp. SB0675_bin_7]MYI71502.1 hypothetical protein [Synechococcus sp. SB0673_bin_10]MYK86514.1 hypothetical protein [Synechococcus sp. SB0669_bin_7]
MLETLQWVVWCGCFGNALVTMGTRCPGCWSSWSPPGPGREGTRLSLMLAPPANALPLEPWLGDARVPIVTDGHDRVCGS